MIPTVIFVALVCMLLTFWHNERCTGDVVIKKNEILAELAEKQGLLIDKYEQLVEECNNDDSSNTNK